MHDAIILAGGENNKLLNQGCFEALIDIAGKPMVTFVAEALAASGQVRRIFVLGPSEELAKCQFPANTIVLEGGKSIVETIRRGMVELGHNEMTLVATADIPLLTAEAVNDFLEQCQRVSADLYYPIVRKEINERHYPGVRRTYVRFCEGTYTGGNLFLVKPSIVDSCAQMADKIIANRKNPLRLCQLLGWPFVIRFIFGILHLADVEARVETLLGITGAVIQSPYPELGIDVDKLSDLELVRSTFSVRV
ncbi:MAG: MobA-like transferase domain containing protein [Firmicutes bacterium]|nr:MobA-like transferase domain containing protein [Bacillota bacterium]